MEILSFLYVMDKQLDIKFLHIIRDIKIHQFQILEFYQITVYLQIFIYNIIFLYLNEMDEEQNSKKQFIQLKTFNLFHFDFIIKINIIFKIPLLIFSIIIQRKDQTEKRHH
ncbi:hypothetical protein pb186bvf_015722 [Paramecium bursaria]